MYVTETKMYGCPGIYVGVYYIITDGQLLSPYEMML